MWNDEYCASNVLAEQVAWLEGNKQTRWDLITIHPLIVSMCVRYDWFRLEANSFLIIDLGSHPAPSLRSFEPQYAHFNFIQGYECKK
jgi:hypothetical protein